MSLNFTLFTSSFVSRRLLSCRSHHIEKYILLYLHYSAIRWSQSANEAGVVLKTNWGMIANSSSKSGNKWKEPKSLTRAGLSGIHVVVLNVYASIWCFLRFGSSVSTEDSEFLRVAFLEIPPVCCLTSRPSRSACDVFSAAFLSPTSTHCPEASSLRKNRPPRSRMMRTIRFAISALSFLRDPRYSVWWSLTVERKRLFPSWLLVAPPRPQSTSLLLISLVISMVIFIFKSVPSMLCAVSCVLFLCRNWYYVIRFPSSCHDSPNNFLWDWKAIAIDCRARSVFFKRRTK